MVCEAGNDFTNDHFNLRIASIFVVLGLSALGSFLPLVVLHLKFKVPEVVFFIFRYVGSGVIVSTAFIHLLAEGSKNLSEPCLGSPFTDYPFGALFGLLGVFVMLIFDIIAHRALSKRAHSHNVGYSEIDKLATADHEKVSQLEEGCSQQHAQSLQDQALESSDSEKTEAYYLQILNSIVLEFGIVFHSVFVGLSLAIAGANEFVPLFIAISFHQMFEGLGLGVRFALTRWPANKQYMPWLLSLLYSFTTPIAISIGIGARNSYPPGSATSLLVNGIFSSFCGGILIYNGLIELMYYDFIISGDMKNASIKRVVGAYTCLAAGAGIMALIGKWA